MKICRKFKGLGLLFLFLAGSVVSAQVSSSDQEAIAHFLQELRNGALLVRLADQDLTLKTLKKKGEADRVAELKETLRREHRETMLSFEQTFHFCPVYFFYARHSEMVRQGKLEGIIFDHQGNAVPQNRLPSQYYVAEFDETKNLGIDGLIVLSSKLIPLEKPLPFYERKYLWLGLVSRSKAKMAEAYNERLFYHYRRYVQP
jgi:hypothetical protein